MTAFGIITVLSVLSLIFYWVASSMKEMYQEFEEDYKQELKEIELIKIHRDELIKLIKKD